MLALAPLLYGIFKRMERPPQGGTGNRKVGRLGAFFLANFISLVGIFGLLTTISSLVVLSTAPEDDQIAFFVGLGLVTLVIGGYAERSIKFLVNNRGVSDSLLSPGHRAAAAL